MNSIGSPSTRCVAAPAVVGNLWQLAHLPTPVKMSNPRFSDDPDTLDSGAGAAPLVDMGALEFQPCGTAGDLDGDGVIDLTDLGILLIDFGCGGGGCAGDLNGDGTTDLTDLGDLLIVFGTSCP